MKKHPTLSAKTQATKMFRVYATDVLFQDVEATSAEEAYQMADEKQLFESCGGGLQLDPAVKDVDADEFIRVGDATSHCKTCRSEIVVTINDSNFNDGECGGCEYQRYKSQPELLEALEAYVDYDDVPRGKEYEAIRLAARDAITEAYGKAA